MNLALVIQDWQFFALLTSFATAVYIHVNHKVQVSGLILVLLRGIFMLAVLSPVWFLFPYPKDGCFYIYGFLVGIAVVAGDKYLLDASAKHGGRLTSLFISWKIFILFAIWSFIKPQEFFVLVGHPYIFAGIIVCYMAMVWAMLHMRKQDTASAAMLAVLPAAFFLSGADIFTKLGLTEYDSIASLLQFVFIGQISCVVGSLLWLRPQLKKSVRSVFNKQHVKGTFILIVPYLFLLVTFLLAITKAPNPAYVGAITVLTTVWLTIYYKFTQADNSSWRSTMILVASAIGLTLLTSNVS